MKRTMLWVLFLMFAVASVGFADDYDLAHKRLGELQTLTEAASGDLVPVYDTSARVVKTMDAGALKTAGDLTFQSTLLAMGRANAASTAASSSTNLAPSSLPYVVFRKYIGGSGGLDASPGTTLPDGTTGQVLVLIAQEVDAGGSWLVTPATSLTISSLTFDAQGETTTLLYVDDTIGWIVLANYGTTIAITKQTGIPAKP